MIQVSENSELLLYTHFHKRKKMLAKMGSIKDRNGIDLTESEDIKKRWQECTEKLYKKNFTTQIIPIV